MECTGNFWAEFPSVNGPPTSKCSPEDVLNYPANHIDTSAISDPFNADIKARHVSDSPGRRLSVSHTRAGCPSESPAQIRRPHRWEGQAHAPRSRAEPVGYGTFVFPTSRHFLSGFDYSTKTNHLGIDLAAEEGDPIYAADGGVVVYAGANSYGYGNMIMVDHGTGFQTLYAHLSQIFVGCGDNVAQGQTIGGAGMTGHASGAHLHFEVRTLSNVINPWDVLPAP